MMKVLCLVALCAVTTYAMKYGGGRRGYGGYGGGYGGGGFGGGFAGGKGFGGGSGGGYGSYGIY